MKKQRFSWLSVLLAGVSAVYLYPLVMVAFNSFKKKAYISRRPFALPDADTFAGLDNYVRGIELTDFPAAALTSLFITVCATALILICTSMCAWYMTRVRTKAMRGLFLLFVFSTVAPFQMVMFTLAKLANLLRLNTPAGIVIIYLGFGAGVSVFLFSGFVSAMPAAVEEGALIDGCGPVRLFAGVVAPMLRPAAASVGILQGMWIWNDYLLPYLVLDIRRFRTIPIAVQYLRGGYGSVDMGAMMAMLVLAILPVAAVYLACQKVIVSGVMAGAVKG